MQNASEKTIRLSLTFISHEGASRGLPAIRPQAERIARELDIDLGESRSKVR